MPNDFTQKMLDIYMSKLAAVEAAADNDPEAGQLWGYRQAAAVLHSFVPGKLVPPDGVPIATNIKSLLYDDIVYTPGCFAEGVFTLKSDIRKQAFKRFPSRQEMLGLLYKNPGHPMTDLQIMWEDYLKTGRLAQPEELGYSGLTNLCQIISWLDGQDPNLPEKSRIEQLLRKKSILANFEHLVAENFTGRETEMAFLKKHVAAKGQSSSKGTFSMITDWFSPAESRPILSVFGPGGIGKSALSGRLLYENALSQTAEPFPFAYLPFDRGNLRIESPFTILVEAASQFGLQLPEFQSHIDAFNDSVRTFRDQRSSLINRSLSFATKDQVLGEYHNEDELLYQNFATLVKNISSGTTSRPGPAKNVLIVFDTFEEVEYRDFESLSGFWRMLNILISSCSSLRFLITGRTSIAKLGVNSALLTELPLQELKAADRILLLKKLGVDAVAAKGIAEQVGGNPLTLRLAANLFAKDKTVAGETGIKTLATKKWYFFQVDDQIIQGQLYSRILGHIHVDDVRKLAHPGMVLRTVNPEVILHILAPQCDIAIRDLVEAESLFEQLKQEQSLVQAGEKGDLVYRHEIRNGMIRLMMQDKLQEVKELRRAAINYYSQQDDEASRAEEMYQRLALDEDDFDQLDARWMTGIETSIISNMDEYSDRAKVWLASRMSLEIPREIFQRADVSDWERNITRKVKQAMAEYQIERALQLLGERKERTDASPLFALEAKAQMLLKHYPEAAEVISKGIDQLALSTNRGRLAELFWLRAQVEIIQEQYLNADESLLLAGESIQNYDNPLPVIQVLCHRLLLRKNFKEPYNETSAVLRENLNTSLQKLGGKMPPESFIVPLALSLLDAEFPKTAQLFEPFASITFPAKADEMLTSQNLEGLDEYRENWEIEDNNSIKSIL